MFHRLWKSVRFWYRVNWQDLDILSLDDDCVEMRALAVVLKDSVSEPGESLHLRHVNVHQSEEKVELL